MRNLIMKAMLFFILALYPSHMTSSTSVIDKNSEAKYERLSLIVYRHNLIENINDEYGTYYSNLVTKDDNISKRRHNNNIEFIDRITCYALDSEALPSISIAQAILETGYGRSNKLENNIFGIKGKGIKTKTKEFYNGKFVKIKDEFQYFNSLDDAFNRHYNIIGKYGFKTRDYKEWAYRIKECGYATDPDYAEKLIKIIENHDLSRLDRIQELNKKLDKITKTLYVGISEV